MKNFGLCLGLATVLMFISCENKAAKTNETFENNTGVNKIPTDERKEADGTSVKTNKDSIDIDSKEVNVKIKSQ